MRFIFFLRALHKMTDIGNLLYGSIPVDLEREVSIYRDQSAHKQDHCSQATYLSRYSAGKQSTVALLTMQSAGKRL
jgi:hypothetical protein